MRINNILRSFLGVFIFVLFSAEAIAEKSYRVRSADNINSIVEKFYPNRSLSKAQIMVGILVENPRAFKDGNINYLMRGRRLKLPDESGLSNITHENAQELLSQHAFYFKEGVTGVEYLLPPILGGYIQKESVDASVVKNTQPQDEQLKKISKLEKESEDLKKRLEKLFEEKKERDQKLLELESSIKNSLDDKNLPVGDTADVVRENKKLEETNSLLQKKLQESRSEIAENNRSTLSLERQVTNLKDQLNQNPDSSILRTNTQEKAVSTKFDYQGLWSKYYWLLPLLLIGALLWFLIKRKKKLDIEKDDDYATQIAESEASSFLQQGRDIESDYINEEESTLETSVKLDVARAYAEAGDTESAIDILREVMEEGGDDQRQQAQQILADIS